MSERRSDGILVQHIDALKYILYVRKNELKIALYLRKSELKMALFLRKLRLIRDLLKVCKHELLVQLTSNCISENAAQSAAQ